MDQVITTPEAIDDWEQPLSDLLGELSATQTELLEVLDKKRKLLVASDQEGLLALQPDEQRLAERLEACQQRRQGLLDQAQQQGLPHRDLTSLTGALPDPARRTLRPVVRAARQQSRLVQHQSLTNWVLVQRTLLHLSQMVEIIATGGEKPPTYEKSGPSAVGGALMDRAV
jgi:hypothetical protein